MLYRIKTLTSRSLGLFGRRPRTYSGIILLAVAALLAYGLFGGSTSEPGDASTGTSLPRVTVASVDSLANAGGPLELVGEVRSVSQVELKAQKSGELVRVNAKAGSFVAAGTVLAEIENAQERAGVLQAQGALASAEASLARVRAGARDEDRESAGASAQSAGVGLMQAKETARSAYATAFSSAQDAILAKGDAFFSDVETVRPTFTVTSATYEERQAIAAQRASLGTMLEEWKPRATAPLEDAELAAALTEAQANLTRTKAFIDRVSYFVSKRTIDERTDADTYAADTARMQSARQTVDGAIAGLAGATAGLAGAENAFISASLGEDKLAVGERPEDIRAAEALVTSARGVLASAAAQLEKSLIRTRISGTVETFGPARGDFVTMFENVATVAGKEGLQVEAYVTSDIKDRIVVGAPVELGAANGIVVSVEPGADPATKRSKVVIGLPQAMGSSFENGSFVRIKIAESTTPIKAVSKASGDGLYIPITALKVLPTGLVVYTVEADSTLKAHAVAEGVIVGDRMRIREGLTSDMVIVTDVRGLNEGDLVSVATNEADSQPSQATNES